MDHNRQREAFTLMEVLVVVIIISIIAGFGVTNYFKSQERAYKNTAMSQLKLLKNAQEMYYVKNETYYPEVGDGPISDISLINEDLNVYIMPTGFSYVCKDDNSDPEEYQCIATREGDAYTVQVERVWNAGINEYELHEPYCVDNLKSCP